MPYADDSLSHVAREAAGPSITRAVPPIESLLDSRSPAFRRAVAQLERFARCGDELVLIVGESGTGKTRFAEHLHHCSSRANRIFHRVSLAAVEESLVASELFGHLPGAFTDARFKRSGHFVAAHGGTLFLDEIGKAREVVQAKLLDAVERREIVPLGAERSIRIDVRIVAATNVCLRDLARQGKFLPDLLARLDGFTVRIPPLRERREDIAILVADLVAIRHVQFKYQRAPTIDSDLMAALVDADWPDNIRELDVTVRRLLIDAQGAPIITLRHCTDSLAYLRPSRRGRSKPDAVASAVGATGNKSAVAREFGISRTTLYRYTKQAAAIAAAAASTAADLSA